MISRVVHGWLALQVLVVSLLPTLDADQWSKLPQLWEHYRVHRQTENQNLGLGDFLVMHYGHSAHRNAENHSHLPLKEHCGSLTWMKSIPTAPVLAAPVVQLPNQSFVYLSFTPPFPPSNIWQPPRLA